MLSAWRATEMSISSVLMTFLSSRGRQYTKESYSWYRGRLESTPRSTRFSM